MEPLVRWLLGGFVVSLLFIVIARWFWKRYDRPSEAALEWQREQEEKRNERKVWESVEMQMRREAEEAERKAAFQIKREIAASSGIAPDPKVVSKAFEALGAPLQQSASMEKDLETESEDSDVEHVPEPVQVRQDAWDRNDEQSDELDEIPYPEIPEAPSLPDLHEPTEQFQSWLTEEE